MDPENFNHILLFKTNITSEMANPSLCSLLNNNPGINSWTVDHEDIDRVLRIVSYTLSHAEIIHLLTSHGYECCELT
ncbi:hypothetical protein OC25_12360 [Pedobacter kyungheensis]|uniref:HMA domain-containing protein n=1 Tax=Pedobacter kyungheensis TaxID=1069985 RepID=A0A0C1D8A5_9SPHI|nr:hypothetical protein [Pedobacter kyungheensis]KIA93561.1 hypothetical protein OC25_12360 [Pedobacter kyungheensis]